MKIKSLQKQNSKSMRRLRRWSKRCREISEKFTVAELKEELRDLNVQFPSKARKFDLVQILERKGQ